MTRDGRGVRARRGAAEEAPARARGAVAGFALGEANEYEWTPQWACVRWLLWSCVDPRWASYVYALRANALEVRRKKRQHARAVRHYNESTLLGDAARFAVPAESHRLGWT